MIEYINSSDRFGFSTRKLCKSKQEKKNAEQSSMFHISTQVKIVLDSNIFALFISKT